MFYYFELSLPLIQVKPPIPLMKQLQRTVNAKGQHTN